MITGPRYKKARRLGPEIFEKTQTQKFALRQSGKKDSFRPRAGSEFGRQMVEKQKARVTYGIGERQFGRYVERAMTEKGTTPTIKLYQLLESRLDNVIFRIGLANSRQASRQMVSHGHILINGKRVTVPSFSVSLGDVIRIREGSLKSPLFADLQEKVKKTIPNWISYDANRSEWKVQGAPVYVATEVSFDISAILEFYTR